MNVAKHLEDQEYGTFCIIGIWIYIRLDGNAWYETDIGEWITNQHLADIIQKEVTEHGATMVLY